MIWLDTKIYCSLCLGRMQLFTAEVPCFTWAIKTCYCNITMPTNILQISPWYFLKWYSGNYSLCPSSDMATLRKLPMPPCVPTKVIHIHHIC